MRDPKAHGTAAGISGDSPVVMLLDASIAQLRAGKSLTSPKARAERRLAFRQFLKVFQRIHQRRSSNA